MSEEHRHLFLPSAVQSIELPGGPLVAIALTYECECKKTVSTTAIVPINAKGQVQS